MSDLSEYGLVLLVASPILLLQKHRQYFGAIPTTYNSAGTLCNCQGVDKICIARRSMWLLQSGRQICGNHICGIHICRMCIITSWSFGTLHFKTSSQGNGKAPQQDLAQAGTRNVPRSWGCTPRH